MYAVSGQTQLYEVVVNQEGQYSIWSINKIVPSGWTLTGRRGSRESCLQLIGDSWTDMRPLSARASMQGS